MNQIEQQHKTVVQKYREMKGLKSEARQAA